MEGIMLSVKQNKRLWAYLTIFLGVLILAAISCSDDNPTGPGSDDFWSVVSPDEVNLDSDILAELTEKLNAGDYGRINSMLIVKEGKIAYENYFNGCSGNAKQDVYAVTQSVTSALIGCAVDDGKLSLDEKILSHFQDYGIPGNMSPEKASLTVEDILTMRAGYKWDEGTYPYDDNRNSYNALLTQPDYYNFMLGSEMECMPGETFCYNSGGSIMLARVIENASGTDVISYAEEKLFGPLGITDYTWYKWKRGMDHEVNTASGLRLKSRDMAKIGYLYLNDGMWEGQQIVSKDWVDKSITAYTDFGDYGYGLHWWVDEIDNAGTKCCMPYASGNDGQYIMYLKDYDMVVVFTADEENEDENRIRDIIIDYVGPAVKK
jgi:CubicO group peptidase (beta-lactamase class C family)